MTWLWAVEQLYPMVAFVDPAVTWAYGHQARSFAVEEERAAWIAEADAERGQQGCRYAVEPTHPAVRLLKRG